MKLHLVPEPIEIAMHSPSTGPASRRAWRWFAIVTLSLTPFGILVSGAGEAAFALAAVACGGLMVLAATSFVLLDRPGDGALLNSLNLHPSYGVLAWVPSGSRRVKLSALIYGAVVAGALLTLQLPLSDAGDAFDNLAMILRGQAALLLVIAAVGIPMDSLGAYVVGRWGVNPPLRHLAAWLLGGGVLALLSGFAVGYWLSSRLDAQTLETLPPYLLYWVAPLLAGCNVLLLWVRHGSVNAWQARVEAAEKGRQLAETQLAMLQARIEPHFLYNTLASVQYLVRKDSASADFLLTQLIRYLRSAMPKLRAPMSTLGQEFELADAYLQIARMRMGGRLAVSVELAEPLHDSPFPPLVLQTLVENALRHGVEPKVGPVHIEVAATSTAAGLELSVTDNGVGLGRGKAPTAGSGSGLANIRERLSAIFGSCARLSVTELRTGGVRATVTLAPQAAPQSSESNSPNQREN